MENNIGNEIYTLAKGLWPLNRSLTGDGNRKTLLTIQKHIPELVIKVPSNTIAFDWKVPEEWHVKEAWIKTPNGDKICNFENNLHLVGYIGTS